MALVTILGATGGTGRHLVRLALERGHQVTALARDVSNIDVRHERLTLVRGDVSDRASLDAAVRADTHSVLSALGHTRAADSTALETGIRHAIEVMRALRVRRLVVLSAGGIHVDRYDGTLIALAKKLIVQRVFKEIYDDSRRMEAVVRASELDWTILTPPRLVDEAAVTAYRTAIDHNLPRGLKTSRVNVADAMLSKMDEPSSFRHIISIAR